MVNEAKILLKLEVERVWFSCLSRIIVNYLIIYRPGKLWTLLWKRNIGQKRVVLYIGMKLTVSSYILDYLNSSLT